MTNLSGITKARTRGSVRQEPLDALARIAELEAENTGLRDALARAGLATGPVGGSRDGESTEKREGWTADAALARPAAAEAEARHGREVAAVRADLAAAAADNDALRRSNAELAAGRTALRDGEARWRGMFERMHEGFALCEIVYRDGAAADLLYLEVNAAWDRLIGIPAAETVGRRARDIFPGFEDFWVRTYARVVETGEPAHFEHRLGALGRWYESLAYRTEPGRFAALFLDVTERKAAEQRRDALVELSDRLRDLRDPSEIARAAAEVIGRALGASRAGYGTVEDEEIIRVERDWTGGLAASVAGAHRLSDYWTGFADDLRRGEVVAVEDAARDPRTAPRHAASYAALGIGAALHVPVVERGRVVAILYVHEAAPRGWTAEEVAFVRGAAERAWAASARARADADLRAANGALRAGEARLHLALEAGRLGSWELDVAADTSVRSPRHDAIFGYEAPPPAWGFEQFMQHVLPEDRGGVERGFAAAVEGGGEWHFECRIRRADGETRWIEGRGQPVRDAEGRQVRLLGTVADVTERRRAEERRALLVNELNHRVKNTLAVVQSLAAQTARGAADLPAFSSAFQARLMALARAHDLLTRGNWAGAPLRAVAAAALEPLAPGGARVDLSGCASGTVLPPAAALALTLALHELATNALKHGALSVPGGRVAVSCGTGPGDGAPVVEWTEQGGPPVPGPPVRRGFGLRLLAAQAGLAADLRFPSEGVRCTLRLPPPSHSPERT